MNAQVNEKPVGNFEIVEYTPTAAALAELDRKYGKVVYDVTLTEGMKAAKEARKELRSLRTALEAKRKELKEPALRRAQLIDSEAKFLTEQIVAIEKPIADQIEREETRVKEEVQKKAEAEQRRVQALMGRVGEIKLAPSRCVGFGADKLVERIRWLEDLDIGEDFAEFQREAEGERAIALQTLRGMLAGAQSAEREEVQREEERKELARLRAEAAERERIADEERRARIAAEEKAIAERRAREDAEAKEARERLLREQEALIAMRPPAQPDPERGAEFDRATGGSVYKNPPLIQAGTYSETGFETLLAAMKKLQQLLLPGTPEAEIVEDALRRVGEL